MRGLIAVVEEVGLSADNAQRLLDYDAATFDEPPDPTAPPDAAELATVRDLVSIAPRALQELIREHRHLERREFVSWVARVFAPILRRSSAERNDIRQRIARRFHTKGG